MKDNCSTVSGTHDEAETASTHANGKLLHTSDLFLGGGR